MELEGKIINFLGDSITEGAGVADPANVFPARLARMCRLKEARNYGIGGTRIAHQDEIGTHPAGNAVWNQDFCQRALEMDANADAVVVFGGTNDFGHGDRSIGSFADRTPETFYGAVHTLMRTLIERYPGKPLVFLTPLHRLNEDNPRGDGYKVRPVGILNDYVDIIKECAAFYALPVLDLHAMSGLQPRVECIQKQFMPDGLHPNDAGHAILADRIAAFLRAL